MLGNESLTSKNKCGRDKNAEVKVKIKKKDKIRMKFIW